MSVGMRSGTNELHGTVYYLGRNPKLNAVTNSVSRTPNLQRQHMWGATVGNPIIRNKLFSFFAYEQWRSTSPATFVTTMPTALEQAGDFSKTLTTTGALRIIYDPYTSTYNNSIGKWSRQPFVGNVIPQSRFDPTAKVMLKDFWTPNNPGDNLAGANNYRVSYADRTSYRNISGWCNILSVNSVPNESDINRVEVGFAGLNA